MITAVLEDISNLYQHGNHSIINGNHLNPNQMESDSIPSYTIRQLILLIHLNQLQSMEVFHIIGIAVDIQQDQLLVKDFEFDEICQMVIPFQVNPQEILNKSIQIRRVSISSPASLVLTTSSSLEVLHSPPFHVAQLSFPFFSSLSSFSSQFYHWLHVDVEMIYQFTIFSNSTTKQIDYSCFFYANTDNQTIHVYE